MNNSFFDSIYNKLVDTKYAKLYLAIALLITFILAFAFNRIYLVMIDDWMYSFVYEENISKRISSFQDIAISQYNHYMNWGGRSVAHTILQLLLWMDPFWHDLLNSLVYVALIYLIYKIANYNKQINVSSFLFISILFWFFQPTFSSTMFWLSGSANYLWTTLIILVFIYPYYKYYRTNVTSSSYLKSIGMLLFGIVAGWTNENMSPAIILLLIIFFVVLKRQDSKIPQWAIWGFIGLTIGCIMMIAAPGNYVRYKTDMDSSELSLLSSSFLSTRLYSMFLIYFKRFFFPFLIPYLVSFYYFKKQVKNEERDKILHLSYLFIVLAHLAFFALVAVPDIPNRALFGIIVFIIISIGILYSNTEFKTAKANKTIVLLFSILTLATFIDYSIKYNVVNRTITAELKKRERIIEEGKTVGQTDFIFTNPINPISRKYYYFDCKEDPKYWINIFYAKYHGINSVKVISTEDKKKL